MGVGLITTSATVYKAPFFNPHPVGNQKDVQMLVTSLGNILSPWIDADATLFPDTKIYDTLIENAGEGADTIIIATQDLPLAGTKGYTLGASTENCSLADGIMPSVLTGDEFDNTLFGDHNANRILGAGGNDKIYGEGGDDVLLGGTGYDYLWGSGGRDKLLGGSDDDFLHGGHSNDKLNGGDGDDRLIGWSGRDRLTGGDGRDEFDFEFTSGFDVILDFTDDVDSLLISGIFTSVADVVAAVTQSGDDAVMNLSPFTQVVLRGFLAPATGNVIADLLDDIRI